MSTKRKVITRRRDQDPVRVYDDGRVAYWSEGRPGMGKRIQERCGTREKAEERAEELRARLRSGMTGTAPKADATLDDMAQDGLDEMRKEGRPEGTIRQYKSEWNTHVPEEVGRVRCRDAALWHYTAIFSQLVQQGASEQVIKNVARTIGYFIKFGVRRGYFDKEPFGFPTQRTAVVEEYRKRAAIARAEKAKEITLDLCPTVADVDKYAAAFESEYPGYGARLVYLAFGTGLRLCELLALKADSINLESLDVQVDWQLDRYGVWPAVKRPKGGKTRTAHLWACYADIAESLITDAMQRDGEEHGWLFPRHRSKKKWADQAGKLAGTAAKQCGWIWSFHWLRHGYASWNLAPKTENGYEFAPSRVQNWLGHAKLSTTTDTYVHAPRGDDSHIRKETRRLPGRSAGA